jgi:hypothetical protein
MTKCPKYLLACLCLIQSTAWAGPEISFESTEIAYGTVAFDSPTFRYFKFTNTGDEPLVIFRCIATCSCYEAYCPEEAIMPGVSDSVKVYYDTQKPGAFTKSITVTSNAMNSPVRLKISGTVLAENHPAEP